MEEKLVRDKIPQIIKDNNEDPEYYICDSNEYVDRLSDKLLEEVNEYIESEEKEEIADILEVIDAIIEHKSISGEKIKEIKNKKKKERGGFSDRIILENVKK